jgi:hypothetical protein
VHRYLQCHSHLKSHQMWAGNLFWSTFALGQSAVMCCHCCCSEICRAWEASLPGGKDHFRAVTGLPVSTYFSAYKFQWMRQHVPEVRQQQARSRS